MVAEEDTQLSETERQMNVVGLPKEYSLAVVATDKDTAQSGWPLIFWGGWVCRSVGMEPVK